MKVTRVIAVGVILGSLAIGALNAQTLRNSSPPAEFPPASFKGKQYVDSRGCIYIRAGIDGNVTWVPRVSRKRKQVCGYKPTAVAGSRPAPAPPVAGSPVIITATPTPSTEQTTATAQAPATVAPTSQPKPSPGPAATVVASPEPAAPKPVTTPAPKPMSQTAAAPSSRRKPSSGPEPTVIAAPKPVITKPAAAPAPQVASVPVTPRKPSPGPVPTVVSSSKPPSPKPVAAPATHATTARAPQRKPSPGPEPTLVSSTKPPASEAAPAQAQPQTQPSAQAGNCPNASTFSQQYINNQNGRYSVRCGPQAEPPVTYGQGDRQSSANLSSGARVMPRQVYENRQNTTNVKVPSGYKTVWEDDRLNPRRAEWTLRPAQVQAGVAVPNGYNVVDWEDGRLNPNRGVRTAQGNSQTSQIWSNTVPRTLLTVPAGPSVRNIPGETATVQAADTVVARVSTRSAPATAPATGGKRIYVRVAIYADESDARTTANALARAGLPMNIAKVRSSGKKAVLAGPFASDAEARSALGQVKNAGFRRARLSK